jgi:hypothetical protein
MPSTEKVPRGELSNVMLTAGDTSRPLDIGRLTSLELTDRQKQTGRGKREKERERVERQAERVNNSDGNARETYGYIGS